MVQQRRPSHLTPRHRWRVIEPTRAAAGSRTRHAALVRQYLVDVCAKGDEGDDAHGVAADAHLTSGDENPWNRGIGAGFGSVVSQDRRRWSRRREQTFRVRGAAQLYRAASALTAGLAPEFTKERGVDFIRGDRP